MGERLMAEPQSEKVDNLTALSAMRVAATGAAIKITKALSVSKVHSFLASHQVPALKFFRPRPETNTRDKVPRVFGALVSGVAMFTAYGYVKNAQVIEPGVMSEFLAGAAGGIAYAAFACPLKSDVYFRLRKNVEHKVHVRDELKAAFRRFPRVALRDGIGSGLFFVSFEALTQRMSSWVDEPVSRILHQRRNFWLFLVYRLIPGR
eukprot:c17986_g2_i4.p1 GENE.c17986_g2_i4~~c17986_g2_i4.p1  ORF type:complete len:206 (-),score=15.21 c17986_g2_i4:372-989(-)